MVGLVSHVNVDVKESSLGNLKHETHLGAGVDPLVEALLGVGVYANEVAGRGSRKDGQQHNQLRHGEHVSAATQRPSQKVRQFIICPRWGKSYRSEDVELYE